MAILRLEATNTFIFLQSRGRVYVPLLECGRLQLLLTNKVCRKRHHVTSEDKSQNHGTSVWFAGNFPGRALTYQVRSLATPRTPWRGYMEGSSPDTAFEPSLQWCTIYVSQPQPFESTQLGPSKDKALCEFLTLRKHKINKMVVIPLSWREGAPLYRKR